MNFPFSTRLLKKKKLQADVNETDPQSIRLMHDERLRKMIIYLKQDIFMFNYNEYNSVCYSSVVTRTSILFIGDISFYILIALIFCFRFT